MKVAMSVMYSTGIGFGMRPTLCISLGIALLWTQVSGALRMAGLMLSIPNGVGSLKLATCPGFLILFCDFHFFYFSDHLHLPFGFLKRV